VITLARHFGLLWVAMEATTLATAPLIYDPADRRSLEAVWKYLVVCSVGIAVALLGIFFLATAQLAGCCSRACAHAGGPAGRGPAPAPGLAAGLVRLRPHRLRHKMGLAPMHTWLPDAHGEAPSPISALLSGRCSILRPGDPAGVGGAAGGRQGDFAGPLLVGFGLVSVAVAAAFLFGQGNYKRMLAYSSVEHMGSSRWRGAGGSGGLRRAAARAERIARQGAALPGRGQRVAGHRYEAHARDHGLAHRLPVSAALLVAGFLAISGSPPFGPFLSEFTLLAGAVRSGAVAQWWRC